MPRATTQTAPADLTLDEIDPQIRAHLDRLLAVKPGQAVPHVLVLGRAGTGKSTLLNQLRQQSTQKLAVVAPTGVAALNVGGETIHSFFKFRPNSGLEEVQQSVRRFKKETLRLYRELELLIIDEISMVRADLFDQIDLFLRLARKSQQAFGGVRVIMFGDLYQLPPVAKEQEWAQLQAYYDSPYFFSSRVWRDQIMGGDQLYGPNLELIELQQVHRQKDPAFIEFLNSVRNKNLDLETLQDINNRLVDETLDLSASKYARAVVLTTTNKKADLINQMQLNQIYSEPVIFKSNASGKFEAHNYPTAAQLQLKKGARVMLINNDQGKRWINGSTGTVIDFIVSKKDKTLGVSILLDDQEKQVEVFPFTWEMTQTFFDSDKDSLERETIGTFTQLPLKLAWAITIHKSQGKTFDQVIIDLEWAAFAAGQTYVALSRCTSLEGLNLVRPLRSEDIIIDERVLTFINQLQLDLGQENSHSVLAAQKKQQLEHAIELKAPIQITYLGAGQVRSQRHLTPLALGEMTIDGQKFSALKAQCHDTDQLRLFNYDRIMEIVFID